MNLKLQLANIASQLSRYSLTLEKTAILVDKPWALLDDEMEVQKLIFKRNKDLILSKNGKVEIGKWDYFPEAKSLLIDRNYDKILCNEAFIDKGVMILKMDGTKNDFFILANENLIPDLDAKTYLKTLRHQKLRISETILADGGILEIQKTPNQTFEIEKGNVVTIDAEEIADGKYQLATDQKYLVIEKGKVLKILKELDYILFDKTTITIQQKYSGSISEGDYVFINNVEVGNLTVKFSKSKNLIIEDGKVVRFESTSAIAVWFNKYF